MLISTSLRSLPFDSGMQISEPGTVFSSPAPPRLTLLMRFIMRPGEFPRNRFPLSPPLAKVSPSLLYLNCDGKIKDDRKFNAILHKLHSFQVIGVFVIITTDSHRGGEEEEEGKKKQHLSVANWWPFFMHKKGPLSYLFFFFSTNTLHASLSLSWWCRLRGSPRKDLETPRGFVSLSLFLLHNTICISNSVSLLVHFHSQDINCSCCPEV